MWEFFSWFFFFPDIAENQICWEAAGGGDGALNRVSDGRSVSQWQQKVQLQHRWSPVVYTPLTLVLSCVNHTLTHTHTHTHTHPPPHGEQLPCRSQLSLDELYGYPEFTCVLIRLEEMIGCSLHCSKEDPDAYTQTHIQRRMLACMHTHTHTHTHTHMGVHIHKALVDGNALGRAPSHRVRRHTSVEFGFCHMWFTRRQTNSHPSLLSVQIYLPPSPVHMRVHLCVTCVCVLQYFLNTRNLSQQHRLCCHVYFLGCSYESASVRSIWKG